MRRLFGILLLILGISFLPVTNQFSANAGRTGLGDVTSEWCDCNVQSPIACYNEETEQLCNGDPQGSGQAQAAPPDESAKVSIGLLVITALFLLKRLY
jgi:hypothetical protein